MKSEFLKLKTLYIKSHNMDAKFSKEEEKYQKLHRKLYPEYKKDPVINIYPKAMKDPRIYKAHNKLNIIAGEANKIHDELFSKVTAFIVKYGHDNYSKLFKKYHLAKYAY